MKRIALFTLIVVLALGQWSCSMRAHQQKSAPVKYVYSDDGLHIQLEVQNRIFKLLIKRPGTYCYNEGLVKMSDEKIKLKTLELKSDPLSEKTYRQNTCKLSTNTLTVMASNKIKFQDYELSRVN